MSTLSQNIGRVISSLDAVKEAIENKGVVVSNTQAEHYGSLISQISSTGEGVDKLLKDNKLDYLPPILISEISRSLEILKPFISSYNKELNVNEFKDWKVSNDMEVKKNLREIVLVPYISFLPLSSGLFKDMSSLLFYSISQRQEVSNLSYMFGGCTSIKKIYTMNTSQASAFDNTFVECRSLVEIEPLDTSKGTIFTNYIKNCQNLQKIGRLDFSSVIDSKNLQLNPYGNNYEVLTSVNIIGKINVDIPADCFNQMIALDKPSLLSILAALADFSAGASHTCKLGAANLNKLTAGERQIAINKNWTLTA